MDDSRPFRPLDAMSLARQILAGDKQGLDWWDRLPVTIRGLEHDGWDAILGRLEELGWHHPGGKDARIKSLRGLSKPLHKFPLRTKDGEKPRRQTYEDWLRLWLILRQIDVDPPALNDLAATIAAALQLPEPPETREHAPTAGREPVSRPWSTPEWRWILAGAGAFSAIAGLLVYFTGHTASPPMEVGLQSKVAAVGAVRPLAPRISPDGRKIAFLDGDELRLADASGGGASGRLASGVFGREAECHGGDDPNRRSGGTGAASHAAKVRGERDGGKTKLAARKGGCPLPDQPPVPRERPIHKDAAPHDVLLRHMAPVAAVRAVIAVVADRKSVV